MESSVIVEHGCVDSQIVLMAWMSSDSTGVFTLDEYSHHVRLVASGALFHGVYFRKDSLESAMSSFIQRCRHADVRIKPWWSESMVGA